MACKVTIDLSIIINKEHGVQKVGAILDLRKEKTVKRIKDGFKSLILKMNYKDIKVQDILDEAEIGRTTFYMHYKDKDEVLKQIIKDIFIHINDTNNSNKGDNNLLHIICHMLRHFKMDYVFLKAIIKGQADSLFQDTLYERINDLIKDRMIPYYTSPYVPDGVLLNHLSKSLQDIIIWWIKDDDCNTSIEDVSYYYFSLIMPALKTKDFDYKIDLNIKK